MYFILSPHIFPVKFNFNFLTNDRSTLLGALAATAASLAVAVSIVAVPLMMGHLRPLTGTLEPSALLSSAGWFQNLYCADKRLTGSQKNKKGKP